MNIAIPIFRERISPRFDTAARFLLVEVENGVVNRRAEQAVEEDARCRRTEFLLRNRVDVLLCGGIRQCDYFSVVSAGIDVYPGLIGETNDVLDAFLSGEISKDGFCGAFIPVPPRRYRGRNHGYGKARRSGRRRARGAFGPSTPGNVDEMK